MVEVVVKVEMTLGAIVPDASQALSIAAALLDKYATAAREGGAAAAQARLWIDSPRRPVTAGSFCAVLTHVRLASLS